MLFCDLVGSTALSTRLDPEDYRNVIAAYNNCIAQVVAAHVGVIARYSGDGVLAYFGYPTAHEDDADQAVRAGLALISAVAKLRVDTMLQVRIEDLSEADDIFTKLMGDVVEPRRDFIQQNALSVENLDI